MWTGHFSGEGHFISIIFVDIHFPPDDKLLEAGSRCCVVPQFPRRLALHVTRCSLSEGVLLHRSEFMWGVQELLPEYVPCCGDCFNTSQVEFPWSSAKLSSHFLLFSMCLKGDSNNYCYNNFDVIMTDLSINIYWVAGQWRLSGKTRHISRFMVFFSY